MHSETRHRVNDDLYFLSTCMNSNRIQTEKVETSQNENDDTDSHTSPHLHTDCRFPSHSSTHAFIQALPHESKFAYLEGHNAPPGTTLDSLR